MRALGDPAWWVRMRSVEALEQIGPVAESPLLLALDDPDPEIRIRAAVALERLGVPTRLIGRIESGDPGRTPSTLSPSSPWPAPARCSRNTCTILRPTSVPAVIERHPGAPSGATLAPS